MRSLILAFAILLVSAGSAAAEGYHSHQDSAGTVETEGVVDVKNAFCPVMNNPVDGKTIYVYKGKKYSFCCPMCIGTFKKNPEKYIEKMDKS